MILESHFGPYIIIVELGAVYVYILLVNFRVLPDVQATAYEVEKQKFCFSLIAAEIRLLLTVMNNKINSHEL